MASEESGEENWTLDERVASALRYIEGVRPNCGVDVVRLADVLRSAQAELARLRAESKVVKVAFSKLRSNSMRAASAKLRQVAQGRVTPEGHASFREFVPIGPVGQEHLAQIADWLEQQSASQAQPDPEREARRKLGEWLCVQPQDYRCVSWYWYPTHEGFGVEMRREPGAIIRAAGATLAKAIDAALAKAAHIEEGEVECRASQTAAMRGEKAKGPASGS